MLAHCLSHLGLLNPTEPSLMLFVTPEDFPLGPFKMSAEKAAYEDGNVDKTTNHMHGVQLTLANIF